MTKGRGRAGGPSSRPSPTDEDACDQGVGKGARDGIPATYGGVSEGTGGPVKPKPVSWLAWG